MFYGHHREEGEDTHIFRQKVTHFFTKSLLYSFFITASISFAGEDWQKVPIGPFGTLNTRDNSYALPANQSPDLLNVELTPGGKSVRKRHGYGTAFTTAITTSPMHGVYDFFDSNGNEVQLLFNDTRLTASVGGASSTVLFSTGPNGATYQCTDSLGYAYCTNTSRTNLLKTEGATVSYLTGVVSTGTMITTAVTRLAMAGFSDAPSRIDFSADTDFTTWGTGSLGTSAVQITVNSPGAKITHITYAFNRLMWFKDTSFGYVLIGNQPAQSDWVVKTVSYDVGTNDNTSVYREGILYFRGKDGHIYAFDGYSYQRLSREISTTINLAQTKSQNAWSQTTQSDFQSGLSTPTGNLSFTINPGSVVPSSFSVTETTTAFNSGTLSNYQISGSNLIVISTNVNVTDYSFEGTSWSDPSLTWREAISLHGENCTMSARTGSQVGRVTEGVSSYSVGIKLIDSSSFATLIQGSSVAFSNNACTWSARTLTGNSSYQGRSVKLVFTETVSLATFTSVTFLYSGGDITYYTASDQTSHTPSLLYTFEIDDVTNGVLVQSSYTSQSYDTALTTNIVVELIPTYSATTNSPVFTLQGSWDNSTWTTLTTSTGIGVVGKRYERYIASTTLSGSQIALSTITAIQIISLSTGSYYSQVHNAPNIGSWDALGIDSQNNGGTQTFYVRASSNTFSTLSSTPTWTSITAGAVPTISTYTFFQFRDDFGATYATQTPTLNSFAFNWFEGNASDKSYATYFEDKIIWSLPIGTGTTSNNRLLIYDLLNQGWLMWDLPSNGFYIKANKLYFGSSNGGYVYKYGDAENDAGSAINAYWKSKDFFGVDPFTTQEIANVSVSAKEVDNSTMTVTYITNGVTSASFTFPLMSSQLFINKNKNLPQGTIGSNFNIQFGNNAVNQPFEVFGVQVGIRPKSWIPTSP